MPHLSPPQVEKKFSKVSAQLCFVCKGTMILTFENPLDEGRSVVVTICKACVGCEVMLGLFYLKT